MENVSNDSLDPDQGDAYYTIEELEQPDLSQRGNREPQPWVIEQIVCLLMKETALLLHQS